jgi:quercetin dioxygenase-like cupin family protein
MHVVGWDDLDFVQKSGRTAADPLHGCDAGGATVRLVRVAPGPRTAHVHPDSVEVIHVLSGSGWHHQANESVAVASGDTLLVPAGTPHATVTAEGLTLACFFPHANPFATTVELAHGFEPG